MSNLENINLDDMDFGAEAATRAMEEPILKPYTTFYGRITAARANVDKQGVPRIIATVHPLDSESRPAKGAPTTALFLSLPVRTAEGHGPKGNDYRRAVLDGANFVNQALGTSLPTPPTWNKEMKTFVDSDGNGMERNDAMEATQEAGPVVGAELKRLWKAGQEHEKGLIVELKDTEVKFRTGKSNDGRNPFGNVVAEDSDFEVETEEIYVLPSDLD